MEDVANGVDLDEFGIGSLGIEELLHVSFGEKGLLGVVELVIAIAGRIDLGFAFGRVEDGTDRVDLFQFGIGLFGIDELLDVGIGDQGLLRFAKRVVGGAGILDAGEFRFGVFDVADGVDLLERGVGLLGVDELLHVSVGDKGFLGGGEGVISRTGRVDLALAFGGVEDGTDRVDLVEGGIGLFGVEEDLKVFLVNELPLVIGQSVVSAAGGIDLALAFGRVEDIADGVDLLQGGIGLLGILEEFHFPFGDEGLLGVVELVVGGTGIFDVVLLFGAVFDHADGMDEILGVIELFGVEEDLVLVGGDEGFLGRFQGVIGVACIVDLALALFGVFDVADGMDEVLGTVELLGVEEDLVLLPVDEGLLGGGKGVVAIAGGIDLALAFGGVFDIADRVDLHEFRIGGFEIKEMLEGAFEEECLLVVG